MENPTITFKRWNNLKISQIDAKKLAHSKSLLCTGAKNSVRHTPGAPNWDEVKNYIFLCVIFSWKNVGDISMSRFSYDLFTCIIFRRSRRRNVQTHPICDPILLHFIFISGSTSSKYISRIEKSFVNIFTIWKVTRINIEYHIPFMRFKIGYCVTRTNSHVK